MNRKCLALAGIICLGGFAQADLNEPFNYSDGALTTVSSGAWQLWDPASSADATVTSGVAATMDNTDVIRTFGNVLQNAGDSANFSFDAMVDSATGGGATDPNFSLVFAPATAPFSSGEAYDQSFGMLFNRDAASGGNASVAALEGQGSNQFFYYPAGFMSPGVMHHFSGTITRTATNATDTISMDGTQIFSDSFALTDPRGLNAVEIWKSNSGSNNLHIDNLQIGAVPEPASMITLALGGLALLRRRRK